VRRLPALKILIRMARPTCPVFINLKTCRKLARTEHRERLAALGPTLQFDDPINIQFHQRHDWFAERRHSHAPSMGFSATQTRSFLIWRRPAETSASPHRRHPSVSALACAVYQTAILRHLVVSTDLCGRLRSGGSIRVIILVLSRIGGALSAAR